MGAYDDMKLMIVKSFLKNETTLNYDKCIIMAKQTDSENRKQYDFNNEQSGEVYYRKQYDKVK